MAYELAIYEAQHKIIAHRSTCKAFSTVPRQYQRGHVVRVEPGWNVIACGACKPYVYVVHITARRVTSAAVEPEPERPPEPPSTPSRDTLAPFTRPIRQGHPARSWPPYGAVALDITHSPRRKNWREMGACHARGRLGKWLKWLYLTEHREQWTITVQKVICAECPVRAECLEQGVWGKEIHGVWGGATPRERTKIRSKWIKEGRRDERPERVDGGSRVSLRGTRGGGHSTPSRDPVVGTDEASRAHEAANQDMLEVWPEGPVPGASANGSSAWNWGEGLSDWGSPWET